MNAHIGSELCLLTNEELNLVAAGQQVYAHEFPGAVNRLTGLRPGEGPIFANDIWLGNINFYGSTDNNLP